MTGHNFGKKYSGGMEATGLLRRVRRLARYRSWSASEVAMVRKMAANGLGAPEVKIAIGSDLSSLAIWKRAKELGIRFHANQLRHYGEETTLPHEEKK